MIHSSPHNVRPIQNIDDDEKSDLGQDGGRVSGDDEDGRVSDDDDGDVDNDTNTFI